jgi:rubredoxin
MTPGRVANTGVYPRDKLPPSPCRFQEIQAGAKGLEAIIMNFPKPNLREVDDKVVAPGAGFKTLQCLLCAFVYDEEAGLPEEGIPPGTRWEDVPENWTCPDCSATKGDFQMIEI